LKPKTLPHSRKIARKPERYARGEDITKLSDTKHLFVGYVFLGLVFLGAISSVYYWEYKANATSSSSMNASRQVESGEQSPQTPAVNGSACELTPVQARQKQTGEIREFPSACHVVDTWEIVN
jgi:hypothetical protein